MRSEIAIKLESINNRVNQSINKKSDCCKANIIYKNNFGKQTYNSRRVCSLCEMEIKNV